jgi:uncharacterized protein with GYD domain
MPTYILLTRFTQQGRKNIKDGPARIEAARKTLESLGGKIRSIHLTLGQYDSVAVVEAPDDEALARFSIATGAKGNVQIESLRAFDEKQYKSLISNMP